MAKWFGPRWTYYRLIRFLFLTSTNIHPNGPYRTRTVGDETNLTVATTQIPQLESCSSVADDEQLQRLVSIWNKLDDATKEVILRVAEAGEK